MPEKEIKFVHTKWLFDEDEPAAAPAPSPAAKPQAPPTPPRHRRKLAGRITLALLFALAISTGSLAGLILVYSDELPEIHDLERYRPSTNTDLYDQKGRLIGSFALEHRVLVNYDDFAPGLRQAVISIEDKSFESHWGVNVFRVAGAVYHDLASHGRAQGASTLTMQLARNLFLSSQRTATRKLQEAYLAIQIERAFTKQQIFTLYANQIYLGSGMYGFEAGSEYYFSKHAKDLTLPEAALLAGLPKGPESYSPIHFPDKALKRRNLVLSEMESDGVITHEQAAQAKTAPLGLKLEEHQMPVAPWFEDEVRQELEKRFGPEQVHEAGLRVETTLDLDLQKAADQALAKGLNEYEHRHGWKGKLENVLDKGQSIEGYKHPDWIVSYGPGEYVHAIVTRAQPQQILARVGTGQVVLKSEDWKWTGIRNGESLVKPGDIIFIKLLDQLDPSLPAHPRRAELEQDSGVEGAVLAIDNSSGDVLAMVGGRDYALSEFNRATQAERQTGSSFKPYVYTAAVEDGVKPEDLISDSPFTYNGWSPHDYENNFKGAMTIAYAFADSRNIPAVRLADRVGMNKVIALAHRFGVTSSIPPYLPVALGAVEISLEEQVASYSVFPNDGIRVKPRFIRTVKNADGITLWEEPPTIDEVVSQKTARTMMTLFEQVTRLGTAAAAAELKHAIGGKTGTTSDYTDAWFIGFSPSVTCGVWVGYDSRQSLGDKETGARAALPIWMDVMRKAFESAKPDEAFPATPMAGDTMKKEAAAVAPPPPTRTAPAIVQTPATTTRAAGNPFKAAPPPAVHQSPTHAALQATQPETTGNPPRRPVRPAFPPN